MRFLKLLVASAVLLGGPLSGEGKAPVPLTYEQLVLSDGRILRGVVVKSYDAKTEKLLLLADGKALSLPVALIPDPIRTQLKEGAPPAGGSTTSTPERAVYAPVVLPVGPGGTPKVVSHAIRTPDQKMQSHQDAARATARTQALANNWKGDVKKVEIISCELEEPVPAQGWIDRYKTRGTITYDCLNAAGASLRKGTTRFEVTTEFPPNRSSAGTLNYVELAADGTPRVSETAGVAPHPFENLPRAPAPVARVVAPADPLAGHKKAAQDKARSYYETPHVATNGAGLAMDFELGEPQAVSGWSGRYRTQGKVIFHRYDQLTRSYRDTTAAFEVLTEESPDGPPRAVDLTPR